MTKESLKQYGSLIKEYSEVKEKLWVLEGQITRLEARMKRIENEGVVKDKVYGGEGGIQGFVIEGYASGDYSDAKTRLLQRKLKLLETKTTLEDLADRIQTERNEIEEFIAHIDDSLMRRIFSFRLVKGMSWENVAIHVGGDNTAQSVRQYYHRFIDNYFRCST